jgi:oxygen-independent coproporphyrinogen III oxidase
MSPLKVDLALVKKYDVAGPRYTSYPPATKFTSALGWPELADCILKNNQTARNLSLYFHIPFCESLCWYCGCTTVITRQHYRARLYLDYLEKEVVQMNTLINRGRKVVQLHWGGGSPTFLHPEEIRRLGGVIRRNFALADQMEASVEIDPRRLTREHLAALREVGFNRASIGVQDFEDAVQRAIHRVQPRELTEQAVSWARELGFRSINFDLIYGLPHQTVESFDRTLDAVLELSPDRLAVFSYAHVPWLKPAQKLLTRQTLPAPEVKLQLLKQIIERLTDRERYVYIGMDHFARPTDELAVAQQNRQLQRNFQGYSTHGEADIYSFGMSSISQIPDAYWQNDKNLLSYYAKLGAGRVPLAGGYVLSGEDKIRREVIMRLMCDLSLDFVALSKRLGIDFESHFENELEALEEFECDGLLRPTRTGFEVTDLGRLFIRNLAMGFDHTRARDHAQQHSRTI